MIPKNMTLVSLFAALITVSAQLSVPIGPVPLTLYVMVVLLTGAVLGSRLAVMSVGLWVLLGAIGLPVFAQGKAGAGVLIGPTGGYIAGFLICSFLVGLAVERWEPGYGKMTAIMTGGLAVIYILGLCGFLFSFQYVLQKPMTVEKALQLAVWPFLPLDILKTLAAAYLGVRLRRALRMAGLLPVWR